MHYLKYVFINCYVKTEKRLQPFKLAGRVLMRHAPPVYGLVPLRGLLANCIKQTVQKFSFRNFVHFLNRPTGFLSLMPFFLISG